MPSITEHENNIYTKEKDSVEEYLIRIIQRYFEVEKECTRLDIEAIIQESFTRVKQWIVRGYACVFSLNNEFGHLSIDANYFNAEYQIDKKTAFNKDFGYEEDTICQGNDYRLYNARVPLEHTHTIDQIEGLQEQLDIIIELLEENSKLHYHDNLEILNMIRYATAQTEIDLIMLENMVAAIKEYVSELEYYKTYASQEYTDKIDQITIELNNIIDLSNTFVTETVLEAVNWFDNALYYTDNKIQGISNDAFAMFAGYRGIDTTDIIDYLSKIDLLVETGTINIQNITSRCQLFPNYDEGYTDIGYGLSAIKTPSKYNNLHKLSRRVKLSFQYTENGAVIRTPLPFYHVTDDNKIIYISAGYNQSNGSIKCDVFVHARVKTIVDCPRMTYNINTKMAYIPCLNLYRDDIKKTDDMLVQTGCDLAIVDDYSHSDLLNLLKNISDASYRQKNYYLQGYYSIGDDDDIVDRNNNILTYYNIHTPQDVKNRVASGMSYIDKDKISTLDQELGLNYPSSKETEYGFILSYKDNKLQDYFQNPKIYYEVFGTVDTSDISTKTANITGKVRNYETGENL